MRVVSPPHDILIEKLQTRTVLDDDDRNAICSLSFTVREVPSHAHLVRDGQRLHWCTFLLSGFAHRYKLTAEGDRQIVGYMIPGDFIDLHHLFLPDVTHNVQSLTRLSQAEMDSRELLSLAGRRPTIARALSIETLVDSSIARETIVNVGRRDGATRLAFLVCEFETRIIAAGLGGRGYQLPMTQDQIGDAIGLHTAHVHRTLKLLEEEELIARDRRTIKILNWAALKRRAGFDPRYLHL